MSPPVVVIGCGPTGLAAAVTLRRLAPEAPLVVLEAGQPLADRDRDDPLAIAAGVGGAGLFSDGKFSFYPAASALWTLGDEADLRASYTATTTWLRAAGLDAPDFPEGRAALPPTVSDGAGFKPYPSRGLDLDARKALIARQMADLGDAVLLGARAEALEVEADCPRVHYVRDGARHTLDATVIIGSGGRFFPLLAEHTPGVPMEFRRVELGVRIEGPSGHPFFGELVEAGGSIDPKWIVPGPDGLSWRTFCCCVEGEMIPVEIGGHVLWSGRTDVPPTGRSNIGFNARFGDADAAPSLDSLPAGVRCEALELARVLTDPGLLAPSLGQRGAEVVTEGLARLADRFPIALVTAPEPLTLWGPTVEGVGRYPRTDPHLQVADLPLFVAGDATGRFRGLVAAMVSGAYVGHRVARSWPR